MIKQKVIVFLLLLPQLIMTGCEGEFADQQTRRPVRSLPELIETSSEHFTEIETANLDGLLQRIGDARLVLLGEATHGTAEFYEMRARITRELVENRGFRIIAVEADWPDASSINRYIHGDDKPPSLAKPPFSDFPQWMWANHSVLAFTQWLKEHNQGAGNKDAAVSFYGLDFYNLFSSVEAVLDYLQSVDPAMAETAQQRYRCLMPWAYRPGAYGRLVQSGQHPGCEHEVKAVLDDMIKNSVRYGPDGYENRQRQFGAVQNARLVKNGEHYYRAIYGNNSISRELRHQNFFETLLAILEHHGKKSKAVVWAHNTHVGDSRAGSMSEQGESSLGQRVRQHFGERAYLVGFGTDHGTVTAASSANGPETTMQVKPAVSDSYESLFHEVEADNFLLPLRKPLREITVSSLRPSRLQRAIGTVYDPENELDKHYIEVSLPRQFDEYIWFDATQAVKPLYGMEKKTGAVMR